MMFRPLCLAMVSTLSIALLLDPNLVFLYFLIYNPTHVYFGINYPFSCLGYRADSCYPYSLLGALILCPAARRTQPAQPDCVWAVAAHLAKVGILTELGVPIHDPIRIEFTH